MTRQTRKLSKDCPTLDNTEDQSWPELERDGESFPITPFTPIGQRLTCAMQWDELFGEPAPRSREHQATRIENARRARAARQYGSKVPRHSDIASLPPYRREA